MKSIHALFVLLALVVLTQSSCSYYVSNGHNAPLFREKNEARLSGSYDVIGGDVDIQGAYAPVQGLGLLMNVGTRATRGTLTNSNGTQTPLGNRTTQFEGGAGYFMPIGELMSFETYALFGGGTSSVYDIDRQYNFKFTRTSIQPGWGVTNKFGDFGISARMSYVNFYNMDIINTGANGFTDPDFVSIQDNPHKFVVEPCITARVGFKYVKLQVQLATPITDKRLSSYPTLSIGLVAGFRPSWVEESYGYGY